MVFKSILFFMKRLIAFIGIILILIGIRFYDVGILRIVEEGTLSVFAKNGYQTEAFLPTGADSYRLDLKGGENVDKILSACLATIKFTEMEGRLIYAYSPRIPKTEWVHGKRVNLMIYHEKDNVAVGVPILKGCY